MITTTLLRITSIFALTVLSSMYASAAIAGSGDLDRSFGSQGIVLTTPPAGSAVLALGNGKILAGGAAIQRYNANGTLDMSFGVNGVASTNNISINGLAVQADGKILATGFGVNTSVGYVYEWYVLRFGAEGQPDASFGTGGAVLVQSNAVGNAIGVQSTGKIVAQSNDFLVRLNGSNGSVDSSFGSNGFVNNPAVDLVIQGDNKILTAGGDLKRFTADGLPDATFDVDGIAARVIDANAVTLQPDGQKIVITGVYTPSSGFQAIGTARYNSFDGSLDNSFGTGGRAILDVGPASDSGIDVRVQADNRIVVLASTSGRLDLHGFDRNFYNFNFSVARYNASGTLDGSFGHSGISTFDYDNWNDAPNEMDLQADGKILALGGGGAGKTTSGPYQSPARFDTFMLRYLP